MTSAALPSALPLTAVSPLDRLEACFAAIDADEGRVQAFTAIARDSARAAAEAATRRWQAGTPLSPVDGLIVVLKDIIETADMPTDEGTRFYHGRETGRDAAAVMALRMAGAVILGKVTTTEFAATEPFHQTVNPHDVTRTPGGSSSGSAAAVAAGFAEVALGSQVVGSTLRPASYCGIIGYKPSVGGLNRQGTYDHFSQSCMGVFGTTLDQCWLTARAISSRAGGDPGYVGVTGPEALPEAAPKGRLGVLKPEGWDKVGPEARAAFEAALERLTAAGWEVVQEDAALSAFRDSVAVALPLSKRINSREGAWPAADHASRHEAEMSPTVLERVQFTAPACQQTYAADIAQRAAIRAEHDVLMQGYDALITLGATGAAPVGLGWTGDPSMNVPASLLGAPALSLPLLADAGLPLGLQLVGRRDGDAALFAVAGGVLAAF
ncbi:amidase [Pseudooceanicola nanhaiensis]|uniref:amidase n=1 Tax=Pseudooceanicola nanhaiensis TaxID=375761 RepID=UPI001CD50611|nr:amidase [Pseudooceanicola nanhaiensis]MCA0919804.1 amidase [Pseudooceanicola nanhaiensis]